MAKKNFAAATAAAAKRVSYLITLVVIAVFNLLITTSCEDDYDAEMTRLQTQSFDPAEQPVTPVPALEWNFNYEVNNFGWKTTTPWTITERITSTRETGTSEDRVSHKDDRYAVIDALRNVSLQYTQEHTGASQVYTSLVSSSATRKEYKDSVRYSAMIEDGNICYLDCVNDRKEVEVRDTLRKLPYIRTKSARVKAINTLAGTTRYQTRATYVSDSICREVVWNVEKEVVGNGVTESKTFNVELRDTFKVLLLSEDDIERAYSRDKNRVVIDDLTERCSFVEVFVMKSGSTHENPKSIILNRELKGIPEYLKTVSSFAYTWRKDNGIVLGNVSKGIRTEGNWVVDSRTDSFGANVSNDAEPIVTEYTFKHEGCTYKDEWLEESFELITPTMAEKNTHVESIVSDNADYDQARLFNNINTTYLGYAQEAGETVKLQKKAVVIKREYWDTMNCLRKVYNDSIVWIPTYVIEWTDGNIIRTTFSNADDRELNPQTDWLSIEANESQTTGNVTVGTASSRNMSREVNGAKFTWLRETRTLSNNARLANSTQENRWRSVEPVGMTVTYRGKSYTYTDLSISTTNTASVTGGNVVDGYHVYNYSDALNYRFGDNTKVVAAPGTIKVLAEGIVSEGWDEASASEVWYDTKVTRSIDWVTKWNTGKEERESYSCDAPRSYKVNSNWSSVEKNNSYGTSNETVTVTSSTQQSKTVKDAVFSWNKEIRSIKDVVNLNASAQDNSWTAEDPMNGKVTKKNQTFDFGTKTVSTSHSDHLSAGSEQSGYMVYTYGDDMSYTVGGNTKTLTAPGKISVKVVKEEPTIPPFFPKEWGELVEARQTVANNSTHDSYVYTWSLRFRNGYVLPVVVRPGALKPDWNFAYVEKTDNTTYNGGTYQASTGTWVNTTAADQPDLMSWSREGIQRASKDYGKAKKCGWDEGHLINGKPSTRTTRYDLSIEKGVLKATDSYTGSYMGTWPSYTGE